jgi:hypothetical protein
MKVTIITGTEKKTKNKIIIIIIIIIIKSEMRDETGQGKASAD